MTLTDVLAAATTAEPVDFLEIRQDQKLGIEPDKTTILGTRGTACSGATDKAACTSALAAYKTAIPVVGTANEGWGDGGRGNGAYESQPRRYAVWSRGDKTGVLKTAESFRAFFAPVDSLADARLAIFTLGYELSCTTTPPSTAEKNAGGYHVVLVDSGCGTYQFDLQVSTNGDVKVNEQKELAPNACGRRPDGLQVVDAGDAPASDLGAWFREMAHLEAASIVAFDRLDHELGELGAPARLRAMAQRSRRDEQRHAAETARLAKRFGGAKKVLAVEPPRERSALEIALENAVEGCVRETYGALVAAWQSRTAADREIRATLSGIARDEARHADLAWSVARWLEPTLTSEERARVDAARLEAIEELRAEVRRVAPTSELVHVAGLPSQAAASALVDELAAVLRAERTTIPSVS